MLKNNPAASIGDRIFTLTPEICGVRVKMLKNKPAASIGDRIFTLTPEMVRVY